ncbi:cytochrome c oxidase assembly protein [Sanguibacter inulinus]|uniref:Cytochrome c oxidase assembly protein n=2 Tax=Sanguibacter inulinus TaxID=60922 RepID=A0A853ESW2_9MICO|nr:cytochrome c oxidase assembly protein [Sanguibacter inulinus]NYS92824.1 cytochrome c oxidase assembly protein [Sanguibacter inulinus]
MYVCAAVIQYSTGRPWPWYRTLFFVLGTAAAASGVAGPVATWSHETFTGHVGAHLLVGMVAPLLLVLSAPVTLALRTLGTVPARRVVRLVRSLPARVLTNPVVAATLAVGGTWVLYRTPLFEATRSDVLLHLLVTLHLLAAGYLYTAAIVSVDPSPHRSSTRVRAAVLLVSIAAHGVLAKLVYAQPPAGLDVADVRRGAQLMFYGGDLVELALAALLAAQWYRSSGRDLRRAGLVPAAVGLGHLQSEQLRDEKRTR